jgi:hypothetical protein
VLGYESVEESFGANFGAEARGSRARGGQTPRHTADTAFGNALGGEVAELLDVGWEWRHWISPSVVVMGTLHSLLCAPDADVKRRWESPKALMGIASQTACKAV